MHIYFKSLYLGSVETFLEYLNSFKIYPVSYGRTKPRRSFDGRNSKLQFDWMEKPTLRFVLFSFTDIHCTVCTYIVLSSLLVTLLDFGKTTTDSWCGHSLELLLFYSMRDLCNFYDYSIISTIKPAIYMYMIWFSWQLWCCCIYL